MKSIGTSENYQNRNLKITIYLARFFVAIPISIRFHKKGILGHEATAYTPFFGHEAKIKIEKYLRDDILFEYIGYMVGSNEITRHLWDIVQNSDTTTKEKTNALSCLMHSYNSRLQTLTSGPESYMNIKKSLSEIDLQRLVENSPVLKAQVNQRKLFQKGLF